MTGRNSERLNLKLGKHFHLTTYLDYMTVVFRGNFVADTTVEIQQ